MNFRSFCGKAVPSITTAEYLQENFYGTTGKTLTEDMVCFQQAATSFLMYYKIKNMHMPWKNKQLNQEGDPELIVHEVKLQKYLDRMYEVVQCKHRKYQSTTEDGIFKELDKVILCQLNLDVSEETQLLLSKVPNLDAALQQGKLHILTNIPIVDILINIDWFTAHFEDRNKILRILKELFNHCTTMKKLLLKHGDLILTVLMSKYDKQCHLYQNKAYELTQNKNSKSSQMAPAQPRNTFDVDLENRDEFLAIIIGQLIRLYAKSKSLSQCLCKFSILQRIVKLMTHEQYIVQSDAQKTFDTILKGPRIYENVDRPDCFIEWVEDNEDDSQAQLNQMFMSMRQSNVYSFKRLSMKLQYEILSIGLKESMVAIAKDFGSSSARKDESYKNSQYYQFATFYVDNKENLKDIMEQLVQVPDEEERIKEELFLLLSFFILTFELRTDKIKSILYRNRENFQTLIDDFREKVEEEDTQQLMEALSYKLNNLNYSINDLPTGQSIRS